MRSIPCRAGWSALVAAWALAGAFWGSGSLAGAAERDTVWLCKPKSHPNPCRGSLRTTVYSPDGESHVENPRLPRRPKIDCFYVYPTVSEDPAANSDREPGEEEIAIAKYQAARFSQVCRVFAPMYRQRTLAAIAGPEGVNRDALRLAYTDIRAAWREYLRHHNRGRGFVLIGHSQGTGMLRALMRERIDDRLAVRRRLVSALLLGGNALVRKGRQAGGDFEHIPTCRSGDQTGCAIAWSTFDETPPDNTRFGRPASSPGAFDYPFGPRYRVMCTNPATLSGDGGALETLVPTEPYPGFIGVLLVGMYGGPPPDAPTPWVQPQDHYTGDCENSNGAHVLMIEPVADARNLNEMPDDTWGLHLADVNIALGNLVRVVRSQARSYLAPNRRR